MNTVEATIRSEIENQVISFLKERNQTDRNWKIPAAIWTSNSDFHYVCVVLDPYENESFTVLRFATPVKKGVASVKPFAIILDDQIRRSYYDVEAGIRNEIQIWLDARGESNRKFTVQECDHSGQWEISIDATEMFTEGKIWLYQKPADVNNWTTGGLCWITSQLNGTYADEKPAEIKPWYGNVPKGTVLWNFANHPDAEEIPVEKLVEAFNQLLKDDFLFGLHYGQKYVDEAVEMLQKGAVLASVMKIWWAIRTHSGFNSSDDPQVRALFNWARDFSNMLTPFELKTMIGYDNHFERMQEAGFPDARLVSQLVSIYRNEHIAIKDGSPVFVVDLGTRQDAQGLVKWTSWMGYIPPFPANVGKKIFIDWFENFPLGSNNPYQDFPMTYRS